MIYLTGFADEAATDIAGQIRATKELGWKYIESRNIDNKNIHDLPEADFDRVAGVLSDCGVTVNCFGSAIANWGKQITDPWSITEEEIKRTIPRMHRLGSRMIRIMSYAVLKDRPSSDQMAEERFKRVREIHRIFTSEGITPVHENCMNYGGMGWTYTLKLVENVPELKLVFDTGNPVFSADFSKPEPRPRQSSWEFYNKVKEHVAYIHIKDGIWSMMENKVNYTFPGEGNANVEMILKDLKDRNYKGGISIEPHLAAVFHDPGITSTEEIKYRNYVEYGKSLMAMLKKIGME